LAFEIIGRLLREIFRFFFATGFWCALMQLANATFAVTQTTYIIRPVPIAANPIHHVAATEDETLVLTVAIPAGRDHAFYREIAKVGREGLEGPVRVRIPLTTRTTWIIAPLSDGFFLAGKDWWYVTLDDHDDAAATTFVRSDGSRATFARPQAAADATNMSHSTSWQLVVVPGEKPRALELTYHDDETLVREVDWSGATRSWRLPPVSYQHAARLVAQPLPDGRIALLTNHDGLSLFLLADDGQVDTVTLRNVRIQQFDAAIDATGRLAIVAARNAVVPTRNANTTPNDTGTIDAAIIDPARPDRAEWSALRHDVRVTGTSHDVQVVTTPGGFVAAWINELGERRIEAAGVDRRGHGGTVVEVGRPSPRGGPFLGLQTKHDEELLFWWDDGEHLYQRRLPISLEGYAALDDFAQSVCSTEAGKKAAR
jgi:hypothetical protein